MKSRKQVETTEGLPSTTPVTSRLLAEVAISIAGTLEQIRQLRVVLSAATHAVDPAGLLAAGHQLRIARDRLTVLEDARSYLGPQRSLSSQQDIEVASVRPAESPLRSPPAACNERLAAHLRNIADMHTSIAESHA